MHHPLIATAVFWLAAGEGMAISCGHLLESGCTFAGLNGRDSRLSWTVVKVTTGPGAQ